MSEDFLKRLRRVSVARAKDDFKTYDNAGPLYFTTGLAGEAGELCNLIKKLERVKLGGPDSGTNHKVADITKEVLMEEIGGTALYLDLLASLYDIDMEEAVTFEFNRVSDKIGSRHRLGPCPCGCSINDCPRCKRGDCRERWNGDVK